jgi:hypothetical protein
MSPDLRSRIRNAIQDADEDCVLSSARLDIMVDAIVREIELRPATVDVHVDRADGSHVVYQVRREANEI